MIATLVDIFVCRYQELLDFTGDPDNGFVSMTIPFTDGFEVMVRKPLSDSL